MTTPRTVFLFYIIPVMGVLFANLMFSAPIKSVLQQLPRGNLGALNPTPWPFMTGNCIGWIAYGFFINDYWVFLGNAPGLIISIWLNLNAAKLLYHNFARTVFMSTCSHSRLLLSTTPKRKSNNNSNNNSSNNNHEENNNNSTKDDEQIHPMKPVGEDNDIDEDESNIVELWKQVLVTVVLDEAPIAHENLVIAICSFWAIVLALVIYLPNLNKDTRAFIVGIVVNTNLVFFYGAPLKTVFHVIQTKDSSSIHRITMITNTLNGAFWFSYGFFALKDYVIAIPNGIGVVLGLLQLLVTLVFPRKKKQHQEEEYSNNEQRLDRNTPLSDDDEIMESSSSEIKDDCIITCN